MRTFIAIELPQEIKDRFVKLQAQLKQSEADVKWVAAQNIHLTLKFLGEIDEEKCTRVSSIIKEVAQGTKQFQISLSSCGAFPKIEFPRVIWVAIDKGDKETRVLASDLEEKIEKLGIPKEDRPFSSHITIGRVRSSLNKDRLVKVLEESENYFGGKNIEFSVTKITLFKSTLGAQGPIYEVLKGTNLKTT